MTLAFSYEASFKTGAECTIEFTFGNSGFTFLTLAAAENPESIFSFLKLSEVNKLKLSIASNPIKEKVKLNCCIFPGLWLTF